MIIIKRLRGLHARGQSIILIPDDRVRIRPALPENLFLFRGPASLEIRGLFQQLKPLIRSPSCRDLVRDLNRDPAFRVFRVHKRARLLIRCLFQLGFCQTVFKRHGQRGRC